MKTVKGYWFSDGDFLPHGDNRQMVIGETHHVEGKIIPCAWGLHASRRPIDALRYARGNIIWGVELSGTIVPHKEDKFAASDRRYLWRLDVYDLLRTFARRCALDTIHLWNAPDVMVRYLKTGDESLKPVALASVGKEWEVEDCSTPELCARNAASATILGRIWEASRFATMAGVCVDGDTCLAMSFYYNVKATAKCAATMKQNRRLLSLISVERKRQGV